MAPIHLRGRISQLWNWLAPPRSSDEEQMRVGQAVRSPAVIGIAGVVAT